MSVVKEAAVGRTLAAGLEALGQSDATLRAGMLDYLELLTRWNRVYNLSAIREPAAMVTHHLLDSLAIRPALPAGALLDIGSGAGLPGLVLAMAEPQRPVTVLDSNAKKTRFLTHVALSLDLANVTVVHARIEQWRSCARFEAITARAYTALAPFWRQARQRLTSTGVALAMKGRYPRDELAALAGHGVSCSVVRLAVPGLNAERHLVRLRNHRP